MCEINCTVTDCRHNDGNGTCTRSQVYISDVDGTPECQDMDCD